jgi:uncharacterized membrane protein YheB (UPF0754 family)
VQASNQLHRIRLVCLVGLPFLLLTSAASHFGWADISILEAFYIISLTANIGYFTNFIAIKMLFKPHTPTALGRQGLIPKNQPQLAAALSATLSDHFLASEHWQDYLDQAQLVPKLLHSSEKFCESWLQRPANQKRLNAWLNQQLDDHQGAIQQLFTQLRSHLVKELGEQIEPQQLLLKSFRWVELQFKERPREMEFIIEPVVNAVAENVPLIARRLSDTLDTHIENQDSIRRGIAKAAKWSANFNEEDIKRYLFRMVASFEFRQTLFEGLQSLIREYGEQQENRKTSHQIKISELLNDFLTYHSTTFDLSGYLQKQLQSPQMAQLLAQFLQKSIAPAFSWLVKTLDNPAFHQALNTQVVKLIEHIDLREIIQEKAAKFSPQKMESIFHHMIRDQLVFIELLGALLGGLSGLALVNGTYFIVLLGLLAGYYGLDYLLTHRKNAAASN